MANNQTAFWMTSFCGGVDFCFLCSIFSAELGWWRIGLSNMNLGLHLYSNYVCAKLESFYEGVEPVEPFVS